MDLNLITNFDILFYAFLFLSVFYYVVLLVVYIGLSRLKIHSESITPSVSVIIAACNEEQRITECMESLEKLDYPQNKFEIILVDDNSNDNTPQIMSKFCKNKSNWQILHLNEKSKVLRGKKNALFNGIKQAKNDIIFTTDADCIVPTGWLRNMVKYFKPDVSMVLGYSPLISGKGFSHQILKFDTLFSIIAAAATTKLGYAYTSVGRNMAYTKEAYEKVGGFMALKKYKSGDDQHLTERFRKMKAGKIDFCIHPDTFVKTHSHENAMDLFHQQVRKKSKILLLSPVSVIFSLLLFVYHILIIILPVIYLNVLGYWLMFLVLKLLIENICLFKATKIFRMSEIRSVIPVMQIIYPAFIIFFSIIGAFQIYKWK